MHKNIGWHGGKGCHEVTQGYSIVQKYADNFTLNPYVIEHGN